ncbi:ATP-binding protein, partial [Streptomyces mangrovisoli]
AYERARRALADGLGTDPGPELTALHAGLLGQDGSADTGPRRAPVPVPVPVPIPAPAVAPAGNIRPRLTSFVGREPELGALRSELRTSRLVTLTGPGGSGKTRLAEEAASGHPQAWLVELAPLDRPEAVPGAVVSALGLRETALITAELGLQQDDPVELLVEHCAVRPRLLILDNCEHVVDAAAALAETLLTRCPALTVLATSREPLGVPGEQLRPVEPLRPDQAHRLFTERAAAVRPDAGAALRDTVAVAEICRRLDGLPLAIELAAARLRMLTPRQIADRLDDRFRLLTAGSRTVLPRQQTLRAVVDWSWDLLDERERAVLREVSVFAGGWDLAAAEAVCTGPVADVLGALVDKSLVVAYAGDGADGMRYRLLETIHEYAVERAAEDPKVRAAAEERHRAWARSLAEEADRRLRTADQLPWMARLETEHDNVRAALDRALLAGDEPQAAAIVLGMGWFWWLRNYRREATEWVERVLRLGVLLDLPDPVRPTPEAIAALDMVAAFLDAPDGERGHPLHRTRMDLRILHLFMVLEYGRPVYENDERFDTYVDRVRDAFAAGGPEAARMPGVCWPTVLFLHETPNDVRASLDAALLNCRAHGGDWEVAVILMFRTHMVVDSPGNLAGVDEDLAELRTITRRAGDRWMRAQVASAAGEAAMARSRFDEARQEYEEALRLAHEVGANIETPFLMARIAEIDYRSGDRAAALAALDEASAVAEEHGVSDSRSFVLLLRAHIALSDGEVALARRLHDDALVESRRGTPPPQFLAALGAVRALVVAAESGPRGALPVAVDVLRQGLEQQCSEAVLAALVDIGAVLCARSGDVPRALRLFAVGDRLRGGHPRPMPERLDAEAIQREARAGLGPDRCAAEHARGTALTPADVVTELADLASSAAPTGR